MRIARLLLPLLLFPQLAAAQLPPSETWLSVTPAAPSVGEDVTLFASVWAQSETPIGAVRFSSVGTVYGIVVLEELAHGHGQIASGGGHSCVVSIAGEVWCWGFGGNRQLGNNSLANQTEPVQVQGLPGPVTQVALGGNHSCAITESQQLWCWGWNAADRMPCRE